MSRDTDEQPPVERADPEPVRPGSAHPTAGASPPPAPALVSRRGLGLSGRIGLAAGIAVALAVIATSTVVYLTTARTLRGEVDRDLAEIAADVRNEVTQPRPGPRRDPFGGAAGLVQVLDGDGEVVGATGGVVQFPVSPGAGAVADGRSDRHFETTSATSRGRTVTLRVLTVDVELPVVDGAVQVALPLTNELTTLRRLRNLLLVGGVIGIAGAGAVGWWLGRRATQPVVELTDVANQVRATGDLTQRIEVDIDDEIGRLATTFNRMLAALERTQQSQNQLVADASHELRTPLTSLRTNIEVLDDYERLDVADRADLLRDVRLQLDEFGHLVDSMVALTRGARADQPMMRLDMVEVVDDAVATSRRFSAGDRDLQWRPPPDDRRLEVRGDRDSLHRAVRNLVDNAFKYGHGVVEVTAASHDGMASVTVRDHGPGVAPAQRERIFDRFHRAPEARGTPGSGLGLAIVAQAATRHGGSVRVEDPPDGTGARFVLEVPLDAAGD